MNQYYDALAKITELQAETTAKYGPRKKIIGSPSGVSETRP